MYQQYNPYLNQNNNNPYNPNYFMSYNNQFQNPTPNYQQSTLLKGQMVDGIDSVKVKDVDLSGNPMFYPNINGKEIYKKQLMNDGTSQIYTYKLDMGGEVDGKSDDSKNNINDTYITIDKLNDCFSVFKHDIVDEIKSLFN